MLCGEYQEHTMQIEIVGVAGLGLLGRGIAACCLAHGMKVIGFTRRQSTHEVARRFITEAMNDLVERAGYPPSLRNEWPARFTAVTTLDRFSDCQFIIETVLEDMQIKQNVFDEIEAVVGPAVPIASNTSAMPISSLQHGRKHPQRFLGMHWSENAHVTRFMELIRGEQTTDQVFQIAADLAGHIGKEPALVQKDLPAFICNRLGYAMYREALHLLESGVADAETIDRSFRNSIGLWAAMCGPFRWMDISSGPALYARTLERVLPTLSNATELPETMQEMIDRDAQDNEGSPSFYSYGKGEQEKWNQLFREHVWQVKAFTDEHFPLNRKDHR